MARVKYISINVPKLDNVAKMRRIFFGWKTAKRLNLLLRPSEASARLEQLGGVVTKTEVLLAINGCFNGSSCEPTFTTVIFNASSISCSLPFLLSIRDEPLRDRAFVIFGLPVLLSADCARLSMSKTTLPVLSIAAVWFSVKSSSSIEDKAKDPTVNKWSFQRHQNPCKKLLTRPIPPKIVRIFLNIRHWMLLLQSHSLLLGRNWSEDEIEKWKLWTGWKDFCSYSYSPARIRSERINSTVMGFLQLCIG